MRLWKGRIKNLREYFIDECNGILIEFSIRQYRTVFNDSKSAQKAAEFLNSLAISNILVK